MTDLTPMQMAWLRSELGDEEPTNVELQATFDALGSVRDVALAHLRRRRSEWLSSPLTINLSGVASLSYAENVKATERRIAQLVQMDTDPSDDAGGGDVGGAVGGIDSLDTFDLVRTRQR